MSCKMRVSKESIRWRTANHIQFAMVLLIVVRWRAPG